MKPNNQSAALCALIEEGRACIKDHQAKLQQVHRLDTDKERNAVIAMVITDFAERQKNLISKLTPTLRSEIAALHDSLDSWSSEKTRLERQIEKTKSELAILEDLFGLRRP